MPFDGESFAGGAGGAACPALNQARRSNRIEGRRAPPATRGAAANSTTSGVLKLFYRRLSAFIGG